MRSIVPTVLFLTMLLTAAAAVAGTKQLISPALAEGANGVLCACTNVGREALLVAIRLDSMGGGEICNRNIPSGAAAFCETTLGDGAYTCRVLRPDGGSVSARQLACTLSAIDGAGNPAATVPVDRSYTE